MRFLKMEIGDSNQVVLTLGQEREDVSQTQGLIACNPVQGRPSRDEVDAEITAALEDAEDDLAHYKDGIKKINAFYDFYSLEQTVAIRMLARHEAILADVPELEDEIFGMYGGWERVVFFDAVDAILSGDWRKSLGWKRVPGSSKSVRVDS